MRRTKVHKRYVNKDKPRPKNNPPLFTDIVEFVVPGFGAFAATRLLTRVAATQVAQRAPSWGKHAGAVTSVGSFLAAWFLAHKWKWLERYHTPVVVGAALAALQSLIQLYLPPLGWVVSDATPDLAAAASAAATQGISAQDHALAQLHLQPTNEDPSEFVYNDSYDGGRYSGQGGRQSMKTGMAQGHGAVPPNQQAPAADVSDLAIDDAIGTANLGVFANATN